MFDPTALVVAEFGDHLAATFLQNFPNQGTDYADFLNSNACEILTQLSKSDAPYHNTEHTIMVTLAGQQIIAGQCETTTVQPEDWVHYILALLLHDIGFLRGACKGDTAGEVVINDACLLYTSPSPRDS